MYRSAGPGFETRCPRSNMSAPLSKMSLNRKAYWLSKRNNRIMSCFVNDYRVKTYDMKRRTETQTDGNRRTKQPPLRTSRLSTIETLHWSDSPLPPFSIIPPPLGAFRPIRSQEAGGHSRPMGREERSGTAGGPNRSRGIGVTREAGGGY